MKCKLMWHMNFAWQLASLIETEMLNSIETIHGRCSPCASWSPFQPVDSLTLRMKDLLNVSCSLCQGHRRHSWISQESVEGMAFPALRSFSPNANCSDFLSPVWMPFDPQLSQWRSARSCSHTSSPPPHNIIVSPWGNRGRWAVGWGLHFN